LRLPDRSQLFGVVKGQWTIQQGIDDAEDSAVRANSKRERKNRNCQKARAFPEAPNRQAQILP
jgi:hypothetical protein